MFLPSHFGVEFFITFWLVLGGFGSAAVWEAFSRKGLFMPAYVKTVFLGVISLAALLTLPLPATAHDNHREQHVGGSEHHSRTELSARDRRSFDAYLDGHWKTAQPLYQQPELINNRRFLHDHHALRDWLANHDEAAQVTRANPRQVLWAQRTAHRLTTRTVSPENVQSLDHHHDMH